MDFRRSSAFLALSPVFGRFFEVDAVEALESAAADARKPPERPGRDAASGGRAHDQRVEGLHRPAVRQPAETVARRRRDGRVSDAGGVAAPRNQEHLPAQGAAAAERRRRVLASQGSRARREGLLSSNRSAPITCSGAPTPSGGAPLIGVEALRRFTMPESLMKRFG